MRRIKIVPLLIASAVLAVLIVGVLLFLPRGLVSLLAQRLAPFRERYYRE